MKKKYNHNKLNLEQIDGSLNKLNQKIYYRVKVMNGYSDFLHTKQIL